MPCLVAVVGLVAVCSLSLVIPQSGLPIGSMFGLPFPNQCRREWVHVGVASVGPMPW
jgi:hypothetical protein